MKKGSIQTSLGNYENYVREPLRNSDIGNATEIKSFIHCYHYKAYL